MTKKEKKVKIGVYIFFLILNITTIGICVAGIVCHGTSGICFYLNIGVGILGIFLSYQYTCKLLYIMKIKTKEFIEMLQEI